MINVMMTLTAMSIMSWRIMSWRHDGSCHDGIATKSQDVKLTQKARSLAELQRTFNSNTVINSNGWLLGGHSYNLSAFAKGVRNDHHNLSRGRDLNRRPSTLNPPASALDHSATRSVNLKPSLLQSFALILEQVNWLAILWLEIFLE